MPNPKVMKWIRRLERGLDQLSRGPSQATEATKFKKRVMLLGIVSNCWREQLAGGVALESLVEQAAREGYRAIEFRQGCAGDFETTIDFLPIATRMVEFPSTFPQIRFNIALAFPFFDPSIGPDVPLFRAGLDAAEALSGEFGAHLRIVDVSSEQTQIEQRDSLAIVQNLVALTRGMAKCGGVLSLENGKQSWSTLRSLVQAAQAELGEDNSDLLHCYDACNLLQAADKPNCNEVVQKLSAMDLAMIHFKQARGGEPQLTVCNGDIDWRHQLACLKSNGYAGPALFELPPHERIWDHLRESREYLEKMGFNFN